MPLHQEGFVAVEGAALFVRHVGEGQQPIIVLHGGPGFIPEACSIHIAQAIPECRYVLLPESGHFSYRECPDEVHALLVGYLS